MKLPQLLREVRGCRECEGRLLEEPRPLLQGSVTSRVLIIGQAPGLAAHTSGVPWDDPSGKRLRDWLGVTNEVFYDPDRIALMPMGFCYPGKARSGDAPPRPECAPLWHPALIERFSAVRLTVIIGRYAIERYLPDRFGSITEAARAHAELLPRRVVLPHPSPRNNIWLKKNPWYERDVLPALRRRVRCVLAGA